MNIYSQLPKPFFILAPMDDVTDTVFRQIVASCASPDLYFSEFVNVDALQSQGRVATLPRLQTTEIEKPIIAQLWGLKPENFEASARQIADGTIAEECPVAGYAGIDLNFGCPDKNVVRNGACSALILPENRQRALEIIQATVAGANGLPVSVKTRLGFNEIDLSWHEFLLSQDISALTIHGRTKRQMSKVPADWEAIGQIRKLRDKIAPQVKIIGNGDVLTRKAGQELAEKYNLDGIMIGRGIFADPFVFSHKSPWQELKDIEKINLFQKHAQLFADTWTKGERSFLGLKKFAKLYINGFEGAAQLREKLMNAKTLSDLLEEINRMSKI